MTLDGETLLPILSLRLTSLAPNRSVHCTPIRIPQAHIYNTLHQRGIPLYPALWKTHRPSSPSLSHQREFRQGDREERGEPENSRHALTRIYSPRIWIDESSSTRPTWLVERDEFVTRTMNPKLYIHVGYLTQIMKELLPLFAQYNAYPTS